MRLLFAIWAAKAVAFACRALGRGGGTSLPGLVALRIHPTIDSCLVARLPRGCVVITGTNGKTTTAKMVATVFRAAGLRVVRNVSGANLRRGAVATLVGATSPLGRLDADIGLFELDEATIPGMVRALRPRVVVVTNLFRDQLDRYGELDTTAKRMNQAFRENLGPEQTIILNADDPLVAELAEGSSARVVRFGIDAPEAAGDSESHAADTKTCPACGGDYDYAVRHFAHIGHFSCPRCGHGRVAPAVRVSELKLCGSEALQVAVEGETRIEVHVAAGGIYNAYNVAAAAALCQVLGIAEEHVVEGLEAFRPAFGRVESLEFPGGKRALLLLAKNPTGMNQVIRLLRDAGGVRHVVIGLNDNIADGRDVSWIWDADFEQLVGVPESVVVTGIRARDMAVRLKYAGFAPEALTVEPDPRAALQVALDRSAPGETVHVVPTYTVLLDVRGKLEREGIAPPFWEEL